MTIRTRVFDAGITRPWAVAALWLNGSVFVLLGCGVLLRHPDAPEAGFFSAFSCLTGIALVVAPAAGGPHRPWALVTQFLALTGVAAALPAFTAMLAHPGKGAMSFLAAFWTAGGVLVAGYAGALLIDTEIYDPVRIGFALYVAIGISLALAMLARAALSSRSTGRARDARLILGSVACGTLPFISLSLVPEAAGSVEIVPAHITSLTWNLIPITIAYAILRHELLGIRRFVHRGLAGVMTTMLVFLIMVFVVRQGAGLLSAGRSSEWMGIAAALTLGIVAFHLARPRMRDFVNRVLYTDHLDSDEWLTGMRYDLLGSARSEDVVRALVKRLRDLVHLESIVLLLEDDESMRVAASAGARADETTAFILPRLRGLADAGPSEVRWRSDVVLITTLHAGGDRLGYLVAGPKQRGEVFLREERRLIETVAPILALAIHETNLVAELCEVSARVTNAEEAERERIARDLHDGPLQKAMFLAGVTEATLRDRDGVARELAVELRELCARLRPAILDDLGLVAAIEWLLEQAAQRFSITPGLSLTGLTDDERFSPAAELALFRVTQEALNNALKHGNPGSIQVSLARTDKGISLTILNDGAGAGRGADSSGSGLGIRGMRERIRQVGGRLTVVSNGAAGAVVRAEIPHEAAGA